MAVAAQDAEAAAAYAAIVARQAVEALSDADRTAPVANDTTKLST
jgi:hypothetical protein